MHALLPTISALCPGLDETAVQTHLSRLEQAYLDRFDPPVVAQHVQGLAKLSADHPVEVLMEHAEDRNAHCTVLAFDHPFEFSLIAGVLAGNGFRIERGDVFTLRRAATSQNRPLRVGMPRADHGGAHAAAARRKAAQTRRDPFKQHVVIDHFEGRIEQAATSFEAAAGQVKTAMEQVLGLLDRGDDESVVKAKRRVNEMVTQRLTGPGIDGQAMLYPVELKIDQVGDHETGRTRLTIVAQDTPAFLYSLATALSLNNLSIEQVRIGGKGQGVEDEVLCVDGDGKPIVDKQVLERVRLSVLLTKQFTYFLNTAPDPFTALERFERLTEDLLRQSPSQAAEQWLDRLADPRNMQDLAKLLGTSDFLWEDFIRAQYESLLPILEPHMQGRGFCQPPETVPARIEQSLAGAASLSEQQDRINKFKDEEVFHIDLDHILSPQTDFRELSRRLTLLAENLVMVSAQMVYEDLVRQYGMPMTDDNEKAHYAVFGLGKLGGVALGYASDIELLFIYNEGGTTTGGQRQPITNTEFFEQHARQTSQFLRTKREGIFEVDLRLRPYGKEGPLASRLNQFRSYFSPDGSAHSFERLALVRMRWIAGNPALGFEIEQLRDALVYDHPQLDLDELWDLWGKQRRQKSRAGATNAKHDPGALADLEGTVQLLQVTHAAGAPQLRTPRLSVAMESLRRAGVLSPVEYADLSGAYYFLRRLINALRMLRGSAQDLFLPAPESDEFLHLARRMGYEQFEDKDAGVQLVEEFQQRTTAVRRFVETRLDRPCPGT